jgi:hypothetical protein
MKTETWAFEKSLKADGYSTIAGVDEAGRGPWPAPLFLQP